MLFLLLGLVAIGWAGLSLVTGKGYYKGLPAGRVRSRRKSVQLLGADHHHFEHRRVPDSDFSGRDAFGSRAIHG